MYRTSGELINSDIENPDGPELAFDLEVTEEVESCLCVQLLCPVNNYDTGYFCQDCFDGLDPDDQELCEEPPIHFLCGVPLRTQISRCTMCGINIADVQPATSCLQCMMVYYNLTHLEREFLVQGRILRTTEI
jgi:hypothetical protein